MTFQCDKYTKRHCTPPDIHESYSESGLVDTCAAAADAFFWVNSKFDGDCLSCLLELSSIYPLQVIHYSFPLALILSRFDLWAQNTKYAQPIDELN